MVKMFEGGEIEKEKQKLFENVTTKSALDVVLDKLSKDLFGRSRTESLEKQICVICGGKAKKFRDRKGEKEYLESAMCQQCQDNAFGVK